MKGRFKTIVLLLLSATIPAFVIAGCTSSNHERGEGGVWLFLFLFSLATTAVLIGVFRK